MAKAVDQPKQESPTRVRTDLYGDPLPPGAVARLGTMRFRHGQWVRSVAFAPDGNLIASAGADHTIRLWDRATGRQVRRITGHQDAVNFVTFTPDAKYLISASGYYAEIKDASVRLWEVATGKEVRRFFQDPSGQPMAALALSPDGTTLAAGVRERIWLIEVPSGRELGVCRMPKGEVKKIRFSPNSQGLAAVFDSAGVCLFDWKTRQLVWRNNDQPNDYMYKGLEFAPDGQALAVAISIKEPMRLLDSTTGKEIRRFQGPHNAAAPILFSHDGRQLFTNGWGRNGIIWEVVTGKPRGTLDPPLSSSLGLALSPDGKTLAEAGDRTVCFWDAATGKGIRGPAGAFALIDAVSLSPDGQTLLTASHFDRDAGARLWDLSTGRQRMGLSGRESSRAVAFSPDGQTFAAGCYHGTPVLADTATGRVIRTCEGVPQLIDSLAFTPDGKLLIGTGWINDTVRWWDPATGKELPPLGKLPQGGGAKCLAFAPGGQYLATGGMDRIIRLWDVAARKEIRQFVGQEGSIWSLAFAPDGKAVAAVTATGKFNFHANGTDRAIRLWDVETGKPQRTFVGPVEGSWSVAWSHDGRMLATGGEDHQIRLWEVATGQERACLTGHEGPVSALAFTADGYRLISGSSDTTVLIWDLAKLDR
jgi:WD40 repeat protein